jgi:hypothetical protein
MWRVSKTGLWLEGITDCLNPGKKSMKGGEAFTLSLDNQRIKKASDLSMMGEPIVETVQGNPKALRLFDRFPGRRVTLNLAGDDLGLRVRWEATLRDGANYMKVRLVLDALDRDIFVKRVCLLEALGEDARPGGEVEGSPVLAGPFFLALEHPRAENRVEAGAVTCSLASERRVSPGCPLSCTAVIGVVPEGQTRRGFLYYLERERACPHRIFLHYNSWYDLNIGKPATQRMTESDCLSRINIFNRELFELRGLKLDAFVWDDGWDDYMTLWRFHEGFPRGFAPLLEAAKACGAGMGVWISPWGGYGKAKQERLRFGRSQGFETNDHGFSLAGPTYFERFRDLCVEMIRHHGVNYLKLDGIGSGNYAGGAGREYAADVDGLLRLIDEVRSLKPDLFINITVGTWPSPYWLWYGDSIWRSGADCDYYGAGTARQQWITYRDMHTYRNIVKRAPLYPMNAMMHHGLLLGDRAAPSRMTADPKDLIDEIRTIFGSGTGLQELYITPTLMPPEGWDALAETAAWARQNAHVLADTHWIGGDPGEGQVYGFASWSTEKGIVMLRNPAKESAVYSLDLETAFERPPNAERRYRLHVPWKKKGESKQIEAMAGRVLDLELAPFEVRILEAVPGSAGEERKD